MKRALAWVLAPLAAALVPGRANQGSFCPVTYVAENVCRDAATLGQPAEKRGQSYFQQTAARGGQPAEKSAVDEGADATLSAAIDSYAAGFIARHRIPGLSLGVVHLGKIIKAAGYGMANLELSVPAGADTVFEIGSITKQFTAEAVMLLVEEGKLHLDDKLTRYLPEAPAAWRAITLRQLLGHTSGLRDWEAANALSYRREYTPAEYIELVSALPLDFAPGEAWAYTNSAYPLLGLVIDRTAGERYEDFVARRIFGPAGMGATRFKQPADIVPRRAAGYVEADGRLRNGEPLRPRIIAANGGILSTAVDMARWDAALAAGRILPSGAQGTMWAPVRLNDGRAGVSGLAWFPDAFRGRRILIHNGSTMAGFSSVVYRYVDDGLGVIVLCNIDRSNAVNVLAQHVAGLVVPGISIFSLGERPDPEPRRLKAALEFLTSLAADRGTEKLAPDLRDAVGKAWRARIAGHLEGLVRFAFLDREDLGPGGRERFGNTIRWIERYKIVSERGAIFYTIELTPAGQVARFYSEED